MSGGWAWRVTRPVLLLATTLCAVGLAWADEGGLTHDARVEQLCQVPPPSVFEPEPADEVAAIRPLMERGDPQALQRACGLWRRSRAEKGPADLQTIRAQSTLGGVLVWLRRSGDALPVLQGVRDQLVQNGVSGTDVADLSSMIGVIQTQRGELGPALESMKRGYEEYRADPRDANPRNRRRAAANYGALLSRARQYNEAQQLLAALLSEYETLAPPDVEAHASVLRALSVNERRQDHVEAALAYTRREIDLRLAYPQETLAVQLAAAEHNLGLMLIVQGHFDEAENVLKAALARADQDSSVDLMNHASNMRDSLASLLVDRGELTEAVTLARQALTLVEQSQEANSPRLIRPLYRLGQALFAVGDVGEALSHYERALMLMQTSPAAGTVESRFGTRLGLAQARLQLGDAAGAMETLRALTRDLDPQTSSPTERGRVQLQLGMTQLALGDRSGALASMTAAEEALSAVYAADHVMRLTVLTQRCELDPTTSCGMLAERLQQGRALYPDSEAQGWLALSSRARDEGRLGDAEPLARRAVVAARMADLYVQGRVYSGYADVLDLLHRRAEAIFWGKRAVNAWQRARAGMPAAPSGVEGRFVAVRSDTYRRLAQRLIDSGRLSEGLAALQLLKGEEQADFLARAGSAGVAPLSLTDHEAALLASLEAAADAQASGLRLDTLRRRAESGRINADERAELARAMADRAASREAAWVQLGQVVDQAAHRLRTVEPPGVTPSRLRPRRSDTVHVYLFLIDDRLRSVTLGVKRTWVRQVAVNRTQLMDEMARWVDDMGSRRTNTARAHQLFKLMGRLIDEPAKAAGARRVVLWLDGPLRYVPVGALQDGPVYLAQRYALVRMAPSAGAASTSLRQPASMPSIRAFGVTSALAGLPALPGVGAEICGIVKGPVVGLAPGQPGCLADPMRGQGAIAGQAFANEYFTDQRLRAAARSGESVLHIGTHFVLRPGTAAKSWLLLGDGAQLRLPELRTLAFTQPALVTLSACETGQAVTEGSDGREIDGLASVLLRGGARRVLASLWRVDDQATAVFMRRFYEALARSPQDDVEALHQAQVASLAAQTPAHVWAAFVLTQAGSRP